MSNAEFQSRLTELNAADQAPSQMGLLWEKVDSWLEWTGDRLNPIVVKEARQALKSKQFSLTFYLLLIFAACWTVLAIALNMPEIFYVPSGPFLVSGYYTLLCVPMILIVPFVAFRSLATEREDGTFELLAITSLNHRQIVLGKFASALLQMMVYYSALAPCIALTYLLKGLDILTIILFLGFLWLASMLLSAFGLALGTLTKARHWQVLLSVLLIAQLVGLLWWWILGSGAIFVMMLERPPYDEVEFWMGLFATVTFLISFIVLFLMLAAGQISFASDNRSTPLRWVMFGQQLLWFGWAIYTFLMLSNNVFSERYIFVTVASMVPLIYWWFMGAFLIGERAELSPRVRRSLPQSLLGRTLLTWFNPGSGTGYVFAVLNTAASMLGFFLVMECLTVFHAAMTGGPTRIPNYFDAAVCTQFLLTALSYLILYLGVGRFLVVLVRHRVAYSVWFSLLLQVMLLALGALVPLVIEVMRDSNYQDEYSLWQMSNPIWTLYEIGSNRGGPGFTNIADLASYLVIVLGGAMACFQFWSIALEIDQTRVQAPSRVLEEDAAARAAHTPHKRTNPWDDDPQIPPPPAESPAS